MFLEEGGGGGGLEAHSCPILHRGARCPEHCKRKLTQRHQILRDALLLDIERLRRRVTHLWGSKLRAGRRGGGHLRLGLDRTGGEKDEKAGEEHDGGKGKGERGGV